MEVERSDMKNKSFLSLVTFIVFVLLIGSGLTAFAAGPVAKVGSFKGEAYIQTGTTADRISQVGQTVLDGDKVQTKDGEVQLLFTDGAVMTVNPYSTTMIQEQEEESGFWVFKTKKMVRRMTAFVGKLHFKSGSSQRENYLQTPTAVCGLRGSEAEFGFNNVQSLLRLITGAINLLGTSWQQGPFANPGASVANRNTIYQKLANTVQQVEKAKQTGARNDQGLAMVDAYELLKLVGTELQKNPNPAVQEMGKTLVANGVQGVVNVMQQIPNLTTTVETTVPATTTETTVPPTTTPTTVVTTIQTTSTSTTTTVEPSETTSTSTTSISTPSP
jgi:hypothetical protein